MTDILCIQFYQKHEKQSLEVQGHRGDQTVPNGKRCSLSDFSRLFKRNHPLDMDLFQRKNELKQTNERKIVENCMHSCGNMNAVAKARLLTIRPQKCGSAFL